MKISPTYLYQVRLNQKEMATVNFVMNDIGYALQIANKENKKNAIFVKADKRVTIKDKFMVLCEYYYKKEIKNKDNNNIIKKDVPD